MRKPTTIEQQRLDDPLDWQLWGPYLAERAWGSVREDYSADGEAWRYFSHAQAPLRAYRWNEDGLGGISDREQRLCLAFAFWNGHDPILKERAFGLTGSEGNHGEDVKEAYFYRDATPSHSYLHYHYKYPQRAFPYAELLTQNQHRSRFEAPWQLEDSGVFDDNRYFAIDIEYAQQAPGTIICRLILHNLAPETATLHVLPTLWFRNIWSWGHGMQRPQLISGDPNATHRWSVEGYCSGLGDYRLAGFSSAKLLFTENDSNQEQLWGQPNSLPYVKDAFHRVLIHGDHQAVNPKQQGSKCAAWHSLSLQANGKHFIYLVLSKGSTTLTELDCANLLEQRRAESDEFYASQLDATASAEDRAIFRQALAGLIWNKQFYHYDVAQWQDGDLIPPPAERLKSRNRNWRHLKAHDIISMPDCWEYPWFACWDLAYQVIAFSRVDLRFAKSQLLLLLNERYLHPNGHLPAYEWNFNDCNPPVHASAALSIFRFERERSRVADLDFLQRMLHKLLLNYAWWLNRKDEHQHDLFEGGFLGLDNISVYNRSEALPPGFTLKQADATGWMAMFSLNMTMMALELTAADRDYEDIAIQCYTQFLAIARAIAGHGDHGISMWDANAHFFKDLVLTPDGSYHRLDVFSWVGLIPLFACEIVELRLLEHAPRFREMLYAHRGGMFDGHTICACPEHSNAAGEHLLSLVDHTMLPGILRHLLNEAEFLAPYGIRSVSKQHAEQRDLGLLPGIGAALIDYIPGESTSALFGGNSNWRGPIWFPTNFSLLEALDKFHRYLGDDFKVKVPSFAKQAITLHEVSQLLSERLINLFRRNQQGLIPAYPSTHPLQQHPDWRGNYLFHEYFHAETGQGLGASHQTGWTSLVAVLLQKRCQTK